MSETTVVTVVVAAPAKPFACHGEPHPGRPCMAKLTQAEAWVTATGMIRHLIGRWPTVKDLADHTYCGRCSALGRKVELPNGRKLEFHRYQKTVVWLEQKRAERVMAARQAFRRYL